jgi:hypothetical protein
MAILVNFPKDIGGVVATELDSFEQLLNLMRCRFDWGGNTGITCAAGTAVHGKELTISGGWELRRKVKLQVRVSDLPDPTDLPRPNDAVTVYLSEDGAGVKYRILSVENRFDKVLTLNCVDTNHP